MPKKITLIAVHGTYNFCNKGSWAKEGTPFHHQLKERFGNDIKVRLHTWSSWNEHTSRTRSAHRLRSLIRECAKEDPDRSIALVGHSHGGNVILYALRDPEVEAMVEKVVCLSTPFLCARKRGMGPIGFKAFLGLALASLPLAAWNAGGWQALLSPEPLHRYIHYFAIGSALFLGGVWSLKWLLQGISPAKDGANQDPYAVIQESFRIPNLSPGKALLVRTPGDEAGLLLGFFTFLGFILRLFHLALKGFSSLAQWADRRIGGWLDSLPDNPKFADKGMLILGVMAFLIAVGFIAFAGFDPARSTQVDAGTFSNNASPSPTPSWLVQGATWVLGKLQKGEIQIAHIALALGLVFSLLWTLVRFMTLFTARTLRFFLSLLLAPLYLIGALAMAIFGLDTMFFAFRTEITSEPTPPGDWQVRLVSLEGRENAFRHGEAHSDPLVTAKVVDWL